MMESEGPLHWSNARQLHLPQPILGTGSTEHGAVEVSNELHFFHPAAVVTEFLNRQKRSSET